MKIKHITDQISNDLSTKNITTVLVCEHCKSEQSVKSECFLDKSFTIKKLPRIPCITCKKDRFGNTPMQMINFLQINF